MSRRRLNTEFKVEASSLVLGQQYSITEACEAAGVGNTAMRRWVSQLNKERQGTTPTGSKALTKKQKTKRLKPTLNGLNGRKRF